MPEMANVAEYMLYSTKDKNENVALEACEFWLTFAEDTELAPYLHPLLGKVAPVLLDCMVYGEDDLLWLEGDAEDANVPDKETDIKPRHYGGKTHGLEHEDPNGAAAKPKLGAYGEENLDDAEEDFDLDDDEFADEMSTEWNLRKCAAAALDVLAVSFGGDLLNVLLQPLKEKLWSEDWLQRESGILALGAMAEGCIEAIEPHLTTLVPYLINTLNDAKVSYPPGRSLLDPHICQLHSRWCDQSLAGLLGVTPAGARSPSQRSTGTSISFPLWRGCAVRIFSVYFHSHYRFDSCFAWFWTTTSECKKQDAVLLLHSKKMPVPSSPLTWSQCFGTLCSLSTSTSIRTCLSSTTLLGPLQTPLAELSPTRCTLTS